MGIRIVPYQPHHEKAVGAFNERMAAGGWEPGFSESAIPGTFPPGEHESLFMEQFLALDQDDVVRGGYVLKHQAFNIGGTVHAIANYTFPLSEGIIDRRFGMIGISMILDAQKRHPMLFDLGLGGIDQPSARVMKGVGWSLCPIPFYFRVLRPYRFLRNIQYGRSTAIRQFALNAAAISGMGWAGNMILTLWKRRTAPATDVTADRVESFGPWADVIWTRAHADYSFAAVRDRSVLNMLYPNQDKRFIRLLVRRGGEPIGWALLLNTRMTDHKQFGDMTVGSIADGLAATGDASVVCEAADRYLAAQGADIIVSNQSHQVWGGALRRLGYLTGPSNFIFTASKPLAALLDPFESSVRHAHLNRGDGDGPINL